MQDDSRPREDTRETADLKPQDSSPARIAAAPPVINPTLRESKPAEIAIAFPDNAAASLLFGHYDQNIASFKRRLGIAAHANGNHVTLKGPAEACEQARRVLESLYARVKLGHTVSLGDVDGAISGKRLAGQLCFRRRPKKPTGAGVRDQVSTRKRGVVKGARNATQDLYLASLETQLELVFAEGPAGTGKTWLAVGHAVAMLEQGLVERLVPLSASRGRGRRAVGVWARRHARQGRSLSASHL